jgi:Phage integrase family
MVETLLELRGRGYTGPHGPVWGTRLGKPLDAHNLRNGVLRPVVTDVGLPRVGFHTFRHTCASLLFAGGKDVKVVQEWLGHSDPGFTLRTYVHLMDEGLGTADFLDAQVAPTAAEADAKIYAVPCLITLTSPGSDRLVLHVAQNADEVALAVREAKGEPFTVNDTSGMTVHVNPSAIAFWMNLRQPAA